MSRPRQYKRDAYVDYLILVLMCGCRIAVPSSSIFDPDSSEFECIWAHGKQKWVSFEPVPDRVACYTWKCRRRGCSQKQRQFETADNMLRSASGHVRLHHHTVWLFCGTWKAGDIVSDLVPLGDDDAPF